MIDRRIRRYWVLFLAISGMLTAGCTAIMDLNNTIEGTAINLSRKRLTKIPDEVFENKSLKVLRLYGNQLDSIPARIGELENLEKLYLGRNRLTSLPKEIGNLKKLKLLSIQYNDIETLPEEIGGLESLEQLWVNQNELTYLPESIGKLKKLVVLKANFNWLDSLPPTIGNCSELQFIHLTRNNLKVLPDSISKLRKLRELHLSNAGPLLQVPESLCDLRLFELIVVDATVALPPCMYVLQTNRLRVVRR